MTAEWSKISEWMIGIEAPHGKGCPVNSSLLQEIRETVETVKAFDAKSKDPVRVLCVDDRRENLFVLQEALNELQLELVLVDSGAEALRAVLKHEFALILMDVRMPEMDGLEAAELIRRRKRSEQTPIIFLTASDPDDTEMFKGYALGAVDYLYKPIIPHILRSKVSVFVDIHRNRRRIEEQAELVRQLEKQEHERQLAQAKERFESERLRTEIQLARKIQQRLFPAAPLPVAKFDISGASYPAEATGGDYFDYIPMCDGTLGIVIGDVSGHGFGPALLMAELRAYLRAFMFTRSDVAEIVALLNRALALDAPEGHFATLMLAKLDPTNHSLLYSSAGHMPGYILTANGEIKALLKSTGPPLAIMEEDEFPAVTAPALEAGELLLFLTDGMVEAHGSDNVMFGIKNVLRVVRENQGRTSREIVDALYHAVRSFCGAEAQLDDMTAIVVQAANASDQVA